MSKSLRGCNKAMALQLRLRLREYGEEGNWRRQGEGRKKFPQEVKIFFNRDTCQPPTPYTKISTRGVLFLP